MCSGALLTVGEGRKGHTKSASISAAGTRHSDLPPLDTNIDSALKRSVNLSYEAAYLILSSLYLPVN